MPRGMQNLQRRRVEPLAGARGDSPSPSSSSRKEASTTLRFFWIKGC